LFEMRVERYLSAALICSLEGCGTWLVQGVSPGGNREEAPKGRPHILSQDKA
jgi:hypothetical protein